MGTDALVLTLGPLRAYDVDWSPDGGRIVVARGGTPAEVLDAAGFRLLQALRWETPNEAASFGCRSAHFDALGRRIVTSHGDGRLRLWTLTRPERWWGFTALAETWVSVLLCAAVIWSLVRDAGRLGRAAVS
jgi:hypothetical protein